MSSPIDIRDKHWNLVGVNPCRAKDSRPEDDPHAHASRKAHSWDCKTGWRARGAISQCWGSRAKARQKRVRLIAHSLLT